MRFNHRKNRVMAASKFEKQMRYSDSMKSGLLGRIINDIEYWIGRGKPDGLTYKDEHWWAGSIEDEVDALRDIYDSYKNKDELKTTQKDVDFYISELEDAIRKMDDRTYYEYQKRSAEQWEDSIGHDPYAPRRTLSSTRIRKRSIKAGYQSFGNSGNPWKDIEALKDSYIKQWWRDYDGEPNTSWDNIFDNVLAEFESYADDEASGFILDKYNSGDIGDGDMRREFDSFIMFLDMNDYDF